MTENNTNLKMDPPSLLSFERKLDVSDALFFAGQWDNRENSDNWRAVPVREKTVRGTTSHRLKTKGPDSLKRDQDIKQPNPQTVDVSTLPAAADTLKVVFTLRVLEGLGLPSACNNAAYRQKLIDTVSNYTGTNGFGLLAQRYAFNLANGRFLWRNRVGAENVEVRVERLVNGVAGKPWTFDALSLSLHDFEPTPESKTPLAELSAAIAEGLGGAKHVLLGITAFVRLGSGQEVFPSQEFIRTDERSSKDKDERSSKDKSEHDKKKTLYQINGTAAMHSQKLGNALRTIDTWYPSDTMQRPPIAVEPYGSVTTQGKAYRQPKDKVDFYTLFDNWVLKDNTPDSDNQHYVMAVLVRGGVFSKEKDGKDEKKEED